MRSLPLFWNALDTVVGCATDALSWRELLGDEWPIASRYLRPTGRLVTAIGCPSPGGEACPRIVVHLPGGRIRAVCGASPKECDPVDLDLADVAVMELHRAALVVELCAALDIAPYQGQPTNRSNLVAIGRHAVAAGISCPVALALGGPDKPQAAVDLRRELLPADPGILLIPTQGSTVSEHAWLRATGHHVVALSDAVLADSRLGLVAAQSPEVLFAEARAPMLARIAAPQTRRAWDLPPDARWEHLTFRLIGPQEITCTYGRQTRKFEPVDLGMRKDRGLAPTLDWTTLVALAIAGGIGEIADTRQAMRVKKRYQLLGRTMVRAFGIEPSPVQWHERDRCYRTDFVISDERPLSQRNFAGRRRGT